MAKTEVDVFELLRQLEEAKPQAIEKLLAQRKEIDEKLAQLGYQQEEPESAQPTKRAKKQTATKASPGPSANYNEAKECPVCKTNGHDGRAHRSQETKKQFTKAELSERGLLPPDASSNA